MELAQSCRLLFAEHRQQERQQCGHMLAGRVHNALRGHGKYDEHNEMQHERRIGAVGELVKQTVLVAQHQLSVLFLVHLLQDHAARIQRRLGGTEEIVHGRRGRQRFVETAQSGFVLGV